MAYNGMSKRIKNALIASLQTITYDAGGGSEQAFVNVVGDTSSEFDSFPVVRVLPAELDTTKASSGENERTVSFDMYVHLPLENRPLRTTTDTTPMTEAQIYDWMYDLTDLIIDNLDEGDFHDVLNTEDVTLGAYFLEAQKGDWSVAASKAGALLLCVVTVDVRYSKLL